MLKLPLSGSQSTFETRLMQSVLCATKCTMKQRLYNKFVDYVTWALPKY